MDTFQDTRVGEEAATRPGSRDHSSRTPGGRQPTADFTHGDDTGPSDGTEPGRTTVAERAVTRIATQVVAECAGVGGAQRRVLGVTFGAAADRDADVTVRMHGSTAVSLAVRCSVPYPHPVARTTDELRRLLMQRVGELTGLTVQRVDITVTELTDGTGRRRLK